MSAQDFTGLAGVSEKKAGTYVPLAGVFGKVAGAYVSAGTSLASQVAALFAAKNKIALGAADVRLCVIGDSTGNELSEWVYRFAQWLATQYPTHTVEYAIWNPATPGYDATITVATGSGARKITIWNSSVGGTTPIYHMGANFVPAIVTTNPDLVLWNHGKNLTAVDRVVQRGELVGAMDQVRLALPGVPHAAMLQFPNRDDNTMASIVTELTLLAADYGDLSLIDSYSAFIAQGKNPALYIDNLHQTTPAGDNLLLDAIKAAWTRAASVPGFTVAPAFLASTATNLVSGKFFDLAYYSGGTPTTWVSANSAVGTVDSAVFDAGKSQSLKITGPAFAAFNSPNVSVFSLRGSTITVAVRQYIPPGSPASVGQMIMFISGPNITYSSVKGGVGAGGFRWFVFSDIPIPANATVFRLSLVCDIAANASSAVNISEASVVVGRLPRRGA